MLKILILLVIAVLLYLLIKVMLRKNSSTEDAIKSIDDTIEEGEKAKKGIAKYFARKEKKK